MVIILASESPRRIELMEKMGIDFYAIKSGANENVEENLSPEQLVMTLAERKARFVYDMHDEACVVGADTIVVDGGRILGKPKNSEEAREMLHMLSGKTHRVYTGIVIIYKGICYSEYDMAQVSVAHLTEHEIDAYIKTGEPFDKAGGYGVQGRFCVHIENINGSYFTVMGLPVNKLYNMLNKLPK